MREEIAKLFPPDMLYVDAIPAAVRIEELLQENKRLLQEKQRLENNQIKAIHRIQLLQMDGEVEVRDLGLIVRDLRGESKDGMDN